MNATAVLSLARLLEVLEPRRAAGQRIALANGLFDLLHVGHLRYLEGSRAEGDLLVVAVNSDRSARALKGPGRPIVPQAERAELIAGFRCVDFVTIFDEPDVGRVLQALRPHVHCKGTDYSADTVPERQLTRGLGIRTAIVGDPKNHATRDLIRQIRSGTAT